VPDGEQLYASKVDEVPTLLACQIDKSGIRLGWHWRLCVTLHDLSWRWRRR
jgi:hypothetical protein